MIRVDKHPTHWTLWLDAPATRNALTADMVQTIHTTVHSMASDTTVRALVLRGAGGHFCAGGDFSSFQDMMATPAPSQGIDPIATANRAFGLLLQQLQGSESDGGPHHVGQAGDKESDAHAGKKSAC